MVNPGHAVGFVVVARFGHFGLVRCWGSLWGCAMLWQALSTSHPFGQLCRHRLAVAIFLLWQLFRAIALFRFMPALPLQVLPFPLVSFREFLGRFLYAFV